MTQTVSAIRGVTKNYGVRGIGQGASEDKTINNDRRYTFVLTPSLLDEIASGGYVSNVIIPEGYMVRRSTLIVNEAFDLATASGDLVIGTGSDIITIADSDLETVGATVLSTELSGKLADGSLLTTSVELGATYDGAALNDDSVGKATVIVEVTTA